MCEAVKRGCTPNLNPIAMPDVEQMAEIERGTSPQDQASSSA